jgi:predicted small lipoprotein YifL
MPPASKSTTAIALALLAVACAGCGQKGALYLPDRLPQAVPATPATPDMQPAPGAQAAAGADSPAEAAPRKKPAQP